jgi:hypothetical protein
MKQRKKRDHRLEQGLQQGHTALAGLRRPVIAPHPALLGVNESRLPQEAQVVADGRLMLVKLGGDVADPTRLRMLHQQVQHAQSRRVGERLEPAGQCRRLGSAECARRLKWLSRGPPKRGHLSLRFNQQQGESEEG